MNISKIGQSMWSSIKRNKTIKGLVFFVLGAIAPLIFPPFKNSEYGYVALILFLWCLFSQNRSKKELFWSAYLFGFSFYVVGFSWINNALLVDDERFSNYIPLVVFAIGAFFGLFWAIPSVLSFWGKNIYSKMLLFCSFYVLMEWVRSFIFTGFPWNLLGTAFSFCPELIQGSAYVGTYGLSFVLLLLCCGLALILLSFSKRCFLRGSITFILLPLLFLWSVSCLYKPVNEMGGLKVRLVQPNIPQTFKWQPELVYQNFRRYVDMSKSQSLDDVDLVVWGETASPYFLDYDVEHLLELRDAIPPKGFLVTGLLRVGMEYGKQTPYNSLFVIGADGQIKDYYDKSHLVPFGEFLPFREYLPDFMQPVANVVGDLGRGEKYKLIKVDGLPLMNGAICYESIFPKEVINPKEKPEILLVLANDGWYGLSAGPYQHLAAAQMRAVEEGVTVIRSANTGISAIIASNGEILETIDLDKAGVADVRLPSLLAKDTFYGKYGNTIPLGGILFLIFICLIWSRSFSLHKKTS